MGWSVSARLIALGRISLRRSLAPILALLLALLPASPGAAQDVAANGTKAPGGDGSIDNGGSDDGDYGANEDPVWGYFLGRTAYIFYHEIAGALHGQDGAALAATPAKRAQLAALLLIGQSDKRFGGAVLGDAVSGWILSWRQDAQEDSNAGATSSGNGWDSKNLSVPQISDLLCALYGSDPAHFHGLTDNGDITAAAAQGCVEGYRKLAAQWTETLSRAGIKLSLPAAPVAASDAAPDGGDAMKGLDLEQRPSTAAALADFTAWLGDVGLISNLAAETNRDLALPAPLKLITLQCNKDDAATANAAGDNAALLCYEWLKAGYDAATAQNIEAPPE